jgi:HD-like signal output (HDOD) protein/class 3 adenylate cyclase
MPEVLVESVTFVFTDIEGSTALWEADPETMRGALQRHNKLLSAAVENHGGYVFKTVGDAFCVTFDHAPDALAAAYEMQLQIANEPWRTAQPMKIRIALHTGDAHMTDGDYHGIALSRVARLLAVARGGQILLSASTERLVRKQLPGEAALRDVGMHRLRDLADPLHVFQVVYPELQPELFEVRDLSNVAKPAPVRARFDPLNLYEIPTLPAVALQVMKLMQHADVNARDVENLLRNDPAISAKLLRVANSAFFGLQRKVTTVGDAVRVLGFTNVQGMTLGLAAFDAFRTERLNLRDFWTHAVATATAARWLAAKTRISPDEAFTVGILHDIGKLVFVLQAEPSYQKVLELQREESLSSREAERSLFDFTHPQVGGLMAERWELPSRFVDAIAHHHDPAAATEAAALCAVVGLADHVAHMTLPTPYSHFRDGELAAAVAASGLDAAAVTACAEHLAAKRESVDGFLSAMGQPA